LIFGTIPFLAYYLFHPPKSYKEEKRNQRIVFWLIFGLGGLAFTLMMVGVFLIAENSECALSICAPEVEGSGELLGLLLIISILATLLVVAWEIVREPSKVHFYGEHLVDRDEEGDWRRYKDETGL
jgi:fumarate reductase subunit D